MHGGGGEQLAIWAREKSDTSKKARERALDLGYGQFPDVQVTTVRGRVLNAIQSFISIRVGSECSPELISTVHGCNCMPIRLHRLSSESLVN